MSLQDMIRVTLLGQRLGEALLWRSFTLRFCIRWNEGLYNSLTFKGEAHGFGGLSVTSILQILDHCDLTDYDICFVQIGEMMSRQLRVTRSVLILPSACADEHRRRVP